MRYATSGAALILVLDRLTKSIAYENLVEGQSIKVIPGIFHIALVLNKGVAFGLFKDQRIFFTLLSLLAIFFIITYVLRRKAMEPSASLALGLILGGAIGNLMDRVRFGYVIDFLDFRIWPVFNIADSAISIGAVILALKVLFKNR